MLWIWVLVALMAYWGYGYLRTCILTLSTASGALVYSLPTKAGPLSLRAESFQIELRSNVVHLNQVTVREPGGSLLASIRSATLQNAIPESLSYQKPILAEVSDASVKIVRLPNGTLDIERFLPARTETTNQVPFSVRLVNGRRIPVRVDLIDLVGPTKWERFGTVSTLNLQGVGQRWIAGGTAAVQGIGSGIVEVRKDPDTGLSIDGTATIANLVPVFRHLIDLPQAVHTPTLRLLQANSLSLSGPVKVFVPNQGNPTFEADVVAHAAGISYKDEFFAQTARFSGVFTAEGLQGTLDAASPGVSIHYVGGFSWGKEAAVGGALEAKVASLVSAPKVIQRFVANRVAFQNGEFDGWLAYSSRNFISISGTAQAQTARYSNETIDDPQIQLAASRDRVAMNLVSGSWDGTPLHGALDFMPQTKALEGLLVSQNVPLAMLASKGGWPKLSGASTVQALIQGTTARPAISLRVEGQAYASARGRNYNLGHLVVAADYSGGLLRLDRLSIHGPNGVVTAVGHWAQKSDTLALDLVGSGVPLALFQRELAGNAAFVGRVQGTSRAPYADGRLELYDASYHTQSIPLVLADVSVDKGALEAKNVQAFRGATRVRGNLVYDFATGAIHGTAQADEVSLSDLTDDRVAGTAAVESAKVGGTLEHIHLSGRLNGRNIVAEGVKVDRVDGQFSLDGANALLNGSLALGQGSITGSASYDFGSRFGQFSGTGAGIDLSTFASRLPEDTDITGILGLSFHGQFGSGKLLSLESAGNVQGVQINASQLGAGQFSLNEAQNLWTGSVSVGDLDRYLDLENGSYNADTEIIQAQIAAHNLSVSNLLAAARPYVAADTDPVAKKASAVVILPTAVVNQLGTVDGSVDALANVSGSAKKPNLDIPTLVASNLSYQGTPSGTLNASANLTSGIWSIPSLTWNGGPGDISISGTLAEDGPINLKGDINDLNPQWLSLFVPSAERLSGHPSISFTATGPTQAPVIDGSLQYLEGAHGAPNRTELALRANVKPGQITANGTYFSNGLQGALSATLPFEYPFTIPKDKPISAEATLPSHPLGDLVSFLPWIDPKRTTGSLSGNVELSGLPDHLKLTGEANLNADALAANSFDTYLKGVHATLGFNGTALTFNASGIGSEGGTASITGGNIDLGDPANLFSESLDTVLENSVAAKMNLDNLRVIQKGSSPMNATFSGGMDVSGKLKNPQVKGTVSLLQGTVSVPNAPTNAQEPLHPTINPSFNVALSMPNSVTVNAGLGQFQLTGGGSLAGTLALPNLDAQLVVDKGTIRLPNARIAIDPGGTIHVVYQANSYGTPLEQANVDVTGTTAITANPYGNIIQRYDVDLQVQGDLLAQQGLQFSAQSNPPDLSQDQILALLGQGGLFMQQSLANSNPNFNTDQQLQQAAFTALPLLFDPVTQRLASGLGLDYLDVEYNPFEGVVVTAARSLTNNLILSARRQISQPLPGQLRTWDVRMSYRLPLKGKIYRNLNLILESTELFPYRIGVEYGFRF